MGRRNYNEIYSHLRQKFVRCKQAIKNVGKYWWGTSQAENTKYSLSLSLLLKTQQILTFWLRIQTHDSLVQKRGSISVILAHTAKRKQSRGAMAQAVSRPTLTTNARVSLCVICRGLSDTGTGFLRSSAFPCRYHSTMSLTPWTWTSVTG
jgi:hypothetical protein